ncbi:hypothetical protein D3C72_2200730 [compost metagenome]
MHDQHRLHAARRQVRITKHPRLVGEAEKLSQMLQRAGRLLAADHGEMVLQPIEIGEKDDAGLVEPGRRREDMAAERYGGLKQVEELAGLALAQSGKARRGGGGDGIKDAQQSMRIALVIA